MARLLLLCIVLVGAGACQRFSKPRLSVVAAASLADALTAARDAFAKTHPDIDVQLEWLGSRVACRYVLENTHPVDVLLVADAELVRHQLMPQKAAFNIVFARDALVLAFPRGGLVEELLQSGQPWQKALEGKRVGYANPQTAPLGYRTWMALELNDRVAPPEQRTGLALRSALRAADARPDAAQLIGPLEAGAFDAAFLYRNEAVQHHFVMQELDTSVNFGDPNKREVYASARLEGADGVVIHGSPVEYSVTVPMAAPHNALGVEFVRFLMSPAGREAMAPHLAGLLPDSARLMEGQVPAGIRP